MIGSIEYKIRQDSNSNIVEPDQGVYRSVFSYDDHPNLHKNLIGSEFTGYAQLFNTLGLPYFNHNNLTGITIYQNDQKIDEQTIENAYNENSLPGSTFSANCSTDLSFE